jgi:hypothetical protein
MAGLCPACFVLVCVVGCRLSCYRVRKKNQRLRYKTTGREMVPTIGTPIEGLRELSLPLLKWLSSLCCFMFCQRGGRKWEEVISA